MSAYTRNYKGRNKGRLVVYSVRNGIRFCIRFVELDEYQPNSEGISQIFPVALTHS